MVHFPVWSTRAKLLGFWVLLLTAVTAKGGQGPSWSPGALCWTEVGEMCPIWTSGVHQQSSSACYPEDKLAGADAKPTIMLVAFSPTFALPWGEMGSQHTGRVKSTWAPLAFASFWFSSDVLFCRKASFGDWSVTWTAPAAKERWTQRRTGKERERSPGSCNAWRSDRCRPRAITADLGWEDVFIQYARQEGVYRVGEVVQKNRNQFSKDV